MIARYLYRPRSGELRTQTLKSHVVRTQSLKVLPLKPGVDQYIAIHATLTARIFFSLVSFLQVHSPAFFCKTSPEFFPVLAVGNAGFSVGSQNKKVTLLDAGSRVECPRNINRLQNMCCCFSGFAFRNGGWSLSFGWRKKDWW